MAEEPLTPVPHPWREKRNLYPLDSYLRKHGFKIYSRPNEGVVLWVRDGIVYEQIEAIGLADLDCQEK